MMKHNKLLFILVLIIIFNHIFAQDVIRSASEYDYPPLALVKDGQADGFSVELLRAALDAVERDVSFYVGPWSEIKTDLAEGKIDVLPLVGRTPEREPLYDFTVPYLTLYGAIFVKEGNTSIRSVEDLKSKTIVVMKGDNAEEYIRREQLSKHIITTTTFEEAFRLVSEGKYDAVITQKRIGMQLLKKAGIENVIPITVIKEFKQDFTFAVTEGDSELLTLLNDGLSRIIINGTFDTIYDKWLDSIALEESKKVNLTAKEKAFLKAHPVITLGGGSTFEPYIMHDDDNNVIGYDADILKLIEINT
ncbi:MAG: transporter substrate-binding domain-containing protein, partial [Candidatus Cloacimonetes bacterium]|nr:transporter substrate-binding domain-containing protein [Candidatus Cloacimonadota bacterium]